MTRSVRLIVNPAAGGGKAKAHAAAIVPLLENSGLDVSVVVPASAAETAATARDAVADGIEVICPVGGDGTVNLTLGALRGSESALAIIPTGTGDDNARTLGHDCGDADLADMIAAGPLATVDLGMAAGAGWERAWLSVLCAGFDSAVNDRANNLEWPRGQAKYVRAMLETLAKFRPINYGVVINDDERREFAGMLMAIGNGPTYGGGMQVCAGADARDGQLTITVLHELTKTRFLRVFPKVYSGAHIGHPAVEQFEARSLDVSGAAVAFADGERLGELPVRVWVEPDALRVVSPAIA